MTEQLGVLPWWGYALASAVFAAATAILAKLGVKGIPSNLATAVRTLVVLVFAWGIVLARGEHRALAGIGRRPILFLVLSGIATGASWLAYFRALQLGPASRVAPLDKVSLALTVLLAWSVLGEPMTWRVAGGAALMLAGALLMIT
jgi:transporter family protein